MIKLTENDVSSHTYSWKEHAEFHVARSMSYLLDKDKSKRLKSNICAPCYYLFGGGLAGQAFTKWTCRVCNKEDNHPNTCTPKVCLDCAKKHSLCISCYGDVHGRIRRKPTLSEDV